MKSFVERQNDTFAHKKVERIVWQPRFSDWYHQNHIHQLRRSMSSDEIQRLAPKCPDLPPEIYGMELDEIYDFLNASARYPGEIFPGVGFFDYSGNLDADIKHEWVTDQLGNRHHKITTPYGILTEGWKHGSSYPEERIIKTKDDLKSALYYIQNSTTEVKFNEDRYNLYLEINDGRVVASSGPWRSPYNKMIVELAGTKATMLLMKRYPKEFDAFCDELARINREVVMPAQYKSPIPYISCGDNVDSRNNPPYVYKKYILPYFEDIAKECKRYGKYSFAHFDGDLSDLLPFMSNELYPFDGIEAPTFHPQGNVTLEEFRKALGDNIIVLDGIPSTIFLEYYEEERFVKFVNQVIEAFSPNLILGVSDEYSPNGLFKRMQMVAGIVEKFKV